jgi:hypothetical protein
MPLCPQITNTPITVTQTADFTVSGVVPVVAATTTQVNTALTNAQAASAAAAAASAIAATAVQTSANTIVNASNQLTAINGNGITVYAGSSPTSGARVVLNSSGLAGFNTGGSATFAISASTGTVEVTGGILSGGSITGTSINVPTVGSPAFSVNALGQMTATSANVSGTITASAGTIGGFTIGSTNIYTATLDIQSGGSIIGGNSSTLFYGYVNVGGGSPSGARLQVNGNSEFTGTITTTGTATMNGDVNLGASQELRVPYAYSTTTANAATVWISTTGQLRRSTASSERYKTDIVNLNDVPELDPKALYDLPVRAFRFKDGYLPETDDRFGVLVPGFIAEEMDAIYPAAADYTEGVETWNDRMIIPAMLALIQDLHKEIQLLKGE